MRTVSTEAQSTKGPVGSSLDFTTIATHGATQTHTHTSKATLLNNINITTYLRRWIPSGCVNGHAWLSNHVLFIGQSYDNYTKLLS